MVAANRAAIVEPFGSAWAGNPQRRRHRWSNISIMIAAIAAPACRSSRSCCKDDPEAAHRLPRISGADARKRRSRRAGASPRPSRASSPRSTMRCYAGGPRQRRRRWRAAAKAAGLDPAKLRTAAADPAIADEIDRNLQHRAPARHDGHADLGDRRPRDLRRAAARSDEAGDRRRARRTRMIAAAIEPAAASRPYRTGARRTGDFMDAILSVAGARQDLCVRP